MSDALARLGALAEQLQEARRSLATAQEEAGRRARAVEDLEQNVIPELMAELGLKSFKADCGLEVEVKTQVHCGITEVNRAAALRWLQENGHGGMVKHAVTVLLGDHEAAGALASDLQESFEAVKLKGDVHPQTLKAWVTGRLEEGAEFPQELFSVFTKPVAKVR